MNLMSKSNKYIIWLKNLNSFVQEGSGIPSLFDSEREAKKCAKELWPKTALRIEKFSYIKKMERKLDKEEEKYQLDLTSKVRAQGFAYKFIPSVASKPICVFLFQNSKERRSPDYSTTTVEKAVKWAYKAAKKFIIKDYPDRLISILDCSDLRVPTWTNCIQLPVDLLEEESDKIQPVPHLNTEGLWVCPVTGKTYKTLGKHIFNNILKAADRNSEQYLPIKNWKAFTYGDGWICPYTGKIFKRISKRLDTHLSKQRTLLT